jgi:kinesin family protein 2/24
MERVYGENLEQMYQDHNVLITKILSEEEDLIEKHKEHVNEIINCEKQEMQLITEVDKSGSDVEEYVQNLDKLLMDKLRKIIDLRKSLMEFNCHLQMEKQL